MTTTASTLLASKPDWAKAALVAEYEVDKSDLMTDYFATSTTRRVFLGWSKHTRDLFSEMRKAAATFAETAHMGPGKDLYTARVVTTSDVRGNGCMLWKGSYSPWHRDLYPDGDAPVFETLAEAEAFVAAVGAPDPIEVDGVLATFDWKISKDSIEHREKYSMGSGYYLKAGSGYSTGWTVSKTSLQGLGYGDIEVPVK